MKKSLLLALIAISVLFSVILSGCQTGGIPPAQYDQVNAQLADAQAKLTGIQKSLADLQAQKNAADKELTAARATIADLQKQMSGLKDQATLTGPTPAETAARIVKNYHDTHVYSTYDLFVCSDMASEVWNMLKAQNVSAVIVVGNKDALISDILQSNHAWVLATVAPGETLALETTGGYAVKRSEKPLYYVGWTFSSPADLKANNDWIKEENIRINLRNQLNDEANKALNNPTLYNKLVELRNAQETEINNLKVKISKLAAPLY